MREYKFRGKAKYNEKRHKINEWIFGDLRINSKGQTFICERQTLLETEVKPETVGQLVGTGEYGEIYEGMKLYDEYAEEYCSIYYDEEDCAFRLDYDTNFSERIESLDGFRIVEEGE